MKWDFINFNTSKRYIRDKEKLKSADDAIELFIKRFNEAMKEVIKDAAVLSKQEKKRTLLLRHIKKSLDKNLGKVKLTRKELLRHILKQSPTEIGQLAEEIDIYIRGQK